MDQDWDFEKVKRAFIRGDSRPLSKWVLSKSLTDEQKEFVAKALSGDVEKVDGRKVKPLTESITHDYTAIRFLDVFVDENERLRDVDIAEGLAKKYGFQDSDSVRRAINRYKKLMREAPKETRKILIVKDKTGQDKK